MLQLFQTCCCCLVLVIKMYNMDNNIVIVYKHDGILVISFSQVKLLVAKITVTGVKFQLVQPSVLFIILFMQCSNN